jgi:putative peptidoglycan lipid II flippase
MSVIIAYQQSNFKFIYPALSLILLNLVIIILTIFFSDLLKIYILPISFTVAYLIAFIFLCIPVINKIKINSIFKLKMENEFIEMKVLISLIFIEGLSLSYVVIDRYFTGMVQEGGIAALNYAFVIFSLPISLFSLPLITTMFSKFSNSFTNSIESLKVDFKNASVMNYFIIVPVMFLLFYWGTFFLKMFYEGGKFKETDTFVTQSAIQYYTIGLL